MNEPIARIFVGSLFSVLLFSVVSLSYVATSSKFIEATSAHLVLEHVELCVEEGGKISESFAKEGSFIAQGLPLFHLDDSHLQIKKREELASLKHAQDQVGLAKMRMHRLMEIYLERKKDAAISGSDLEDLKQVLYDLEEAKVGLDAASSLVEWKESKLKTIEEEIARKRIVAPIDGMIGEVRVNKGATIVPGQPFVVLYQPKQAFIYAFIDEKNVRDVSLGAEATVFLPSHPHIRCKGALFFISPEVAAGGKVPVKISLDVPNEILKSNMSAQVILKKNSKKLLSSN